MRKLLASLVVAALAAPVGASVVDPGTESWRSMMMGKESGGNPRATTSLGSATGLYQFTYGTLRDLGYISAGPESVPFGAGEWAGVTWTGLDGVRSREDFMDSVEAQNRALDRLTERNWGSIASAVDIGAEVNGVPLTQGGALSAAHMMGAGAFRQWAACGYAASCLDPAQARANNMTLDQYQAHLMRRMAAGAGVDPSTIAMAGAQGAPLPAGMLMPREPLGGPAAIAFVRRDGRR